MSKICLIVDLNVKPELLDEFIEMFKKEFIARSRNEDGCETYELATAPDDAGKLTIVEVWSSQKHLDTHMALSWFAEWGPKMKAMQETPLTVTKLVSI